MARLIDADELIEYIQGTDKLLDFQKDECIECINACDTVDDVCKWQVDGVYLISPHKPLVSCVTDEGYRYYYCPVCGKKIKAVGD